MAETIPFFIRIRQSSIISFCKGWHTGTDPYAVSCTTDNEDSTIFFINKISQEVDLPMVYQEMKAKLSSEIIVKQKVGQHPHINVTDNDDMEQWDAVIMGNDELLKYMSETV